MSGEIWKPNTVVAAVIEREGRFLFVEEISPEGRVVINQPAGHLDAGETLLTAVTRETMEESAWEVEPRALIGVYLMEPAGSAVTYLRFCFHCEPLVHHPARKLDKEIIQPLWLSRDELIERQAQHRSPLVLRCVDDYLTGTRYPLSLIHDFRF